MRGIHLLLGTGLFFLLFSACMKSNAARVDMGTDTGLGSGDMGPPDAVVLEATVDPCDPDGGMVTLGQPCMMASECDDGCFCNGTELCTDHTCRAGDDPCAGLTAQSCATTSCLEEANRCFVQPHDDRCSDNNACNGREICDPTTGCHGSPAPECNDEDPCTLDGCDPAKGCTYAPRDLDMDTYVDARCGGDDCNDMPPGGAAVHPGATEICDNNRDDNCDSYRDYNDSNCIPTNDTCSSARALPGPGTYSASTRTLKADYVLSCDPITTTPRPPDVVFTFQLTGVEDVRVSFTGAGGGEIGIREMASCEAGPGIVCGRDDAVPMASVRGLGPGTYAIIVRANTPSAAFDLTLTITSPDNALPGDDCAHVVPVMADGPTVTASTIGLLEDYSPSCGAVSAGYRDIVFGFSVGGTTPRDVIVVTTLPNGDNGTDIVTYSTDPCGPTTSELRCRSPLSARDTELFRSLAPGNYYVTVSTPIGGNASVTVTTAPPTTAPPNDLCGGATVLPYPTSGSLGGTLIGYDDDAASSDCAGPRNSFPDAFYTFTSTANGTFDALVRSPSGTTTPIYLALRSSCTGMVIQCVASVIQGSGTDVHQLATLDASLPAGTYVLQVEEGTLGALTTTDYTIQWIFGP